MTISPELKRIYASAPEGQKYVETLQLSHPSFPGDYFLTNDELVWTFLLEDGSTQSFERVPFSLKLPKHDDQGRQDMQIAIGNIGRELVDAIELAITAPRNPIIATYRVYLNTAGSSPQTNPSIRLSILTLDVTTETVTAIAGRADVLNKSFPSDIYRLDNFPGLDR